MDPMICDPALNGECVPQKPRVSRVRKQTRPKVASKNYPNVGFAVINALRRIIISEIPYVATFRNEDRSATRAGGFIVRENSGRLHDDMLLDRFALVPIHLSREEVLNFIPGSVVVDLKVSNEGTHVRDVTSADLRTKLFDKEHPNARNCFPPCEITGDHILITKLYPGESVDVSATLEKSTPCEHAAFAVASSVQIRFQIDEDACRREVESLRAAATCPRDAERALNHHRHVGRNRLIMLNGRGEPICTTLTVESECGLSGQDVIDFAQEELIRKFTNENISYDVSENADGVSYTLQRQGHTFGSVLQEICMRDKDDLGIRALGYYESHPLEAVITVRVSIDSSTDKVMPPETLFSKLLAHCARYLETLFATEDAPPPSPTSRPGLSGSPSLPK